MDVQQLIQRAPLRSASILAALLLCCGVIAALVAGARWFVVETPSMGTAAPVGSLVITAPGPIRIGEVVAFTPPGVPRTYTHRVFSMTPAGGIRTKGDINGAPDPWTIRPSAVIGTAIAIVPGGGYALRGLPPFLVAGSAVWLLTGLLRRRDRRASARIIGLHLAATGVLLWLHPFVQVVTIATEADGGVASASVVSTGLLPIRLVDTAGTVVARLTVGTPAVVDLPASVGGGSARVAAVPDLGIGLQLLMIAIAVLPSLVVMIVGLPREEAA